MADYGKKSSEKWEDVHKRALKEFERCRDADKHNREAALSDLKFWRLGDQWPDGAKSQREIERRPCLTFNKGPAFVRQVVNDARQNKPAIKVHPVDDTADVQVADIINGLIRNIEYSSNADVAYDTGIDFAVSCSVGYWRVGIEYSHDDTFEKDLEIQRIDNPLAVYRDYESTAADSSDWKRCFVVDSLEREDHNRKYKGKDITSIDSDAFDGMPDEWKDGDCVLIAEYWCRKEVPHTICLLSTGEVVRKDWLAEDVPDMPGVTNMDTLTERGVTIQAERESLGYEVTQYIMNGIEILEENKWAGRYIPIVPVYGEEICVEGKRYVRSLLRDARSAQENFNYWRSASTELVALAPKAPFIGPVGSFVTDADKWATANTQTHQYIEYDAVFENGVPLPPPQRQPFAGVPAGVLQEALNATDDMKSVIGIYDASLGARSNETSGVAINARKAEGDNSTFHFIDNQARAIRHTGRILIDLIPHVYNKARVVRIMGVDKKPQNVQVNQPQEDGSVLYDLTAGKYDLTVDTGPSFQTRREEASAGMVELLRALPQAAPIVAPRLAKAQDWPEAEDVARELETLNPAAGGKNPQVMQVQEQMQQMGQALQQTQQELQQAQTQLKDKQGDLELQAAKVQIDAYNAETQRLKIVADQKMQVEEQLANQINQQAANTPDIAPGADITSPAQEPAQAQPDQSAQAMAAIMEEMRQLRALMSAPRRKTLVRGPDGRASHAIEEIDMPQLEMQGDELREGEQ